MLQLGMLLLLFVTSAHAQQEGDFRTYGSGSWNDHLVWEQYSAANGWTKSTGAIPNSSNNTVTVNHALVLQRSAEAGTLVLNANISLGANTLSVARNISVNAGIIDAANGTVRFSGSQAQTIPANAFLNKRVKRLVIDNAVSVRTVDSLKITRSLKLERGTFFTNDRVVLAADSNYTAWLEPVPLSASIEGRMIAEKYLPGKRVFHFFSHPFNHSIGLSELIDDIDITGEGGASNGFTPTQTNNPSAFWYDTERGNTNVESAPDPGWIAFTNTAGTGSNAWEPLSAARIFVRGAKGQGLTTLNYSPSPVVSDMMGLVNTGSRSFSLQRSANSGHNFIGNPYPAPVNLNSVWRRSTLGANFYIWDATAATTGIYTAWPFSVPYILQPMTGIFVEQQQGQDNVMLFEEEDKYDDQSAAPLTPALPRYAHFTITGTDNKLWDRLFLISNAAALDVEDAMDANKVTNPVLNFYTHNGGKKYAIDARNIQGQGAIPLGINSTLKGTFSLNLASANFDGFELKIYDKYTNKVVGLAKGKYDFEINNDTASYGDYRFVLMMDTMPVAPVENVIFATVTNQGSAALVQWQWDTSFIATTFNIQRAPDTLSFATIGFTDANGSTSYSWADATPLAGRSYYRVQAILANGGTVESNIVAYDNNPTQANADFVIMQNPTVNKTVKMEWKNIPKGSYSVSLLSQSGQPLQQQTVQHSGSKSTYTLTAPTAVHGLYTIAVQGQQYKGEKKVIIK